MNIPRLRAVVRATGRPVSSTRIASVGPSLHARARPALGRWPSGDYGGRPPGGYPGGAAPLSPAAAEEGAGPGAGAGASAAAAAGRGADAGEAGEGVGACAGAGVDGAEVERAGAGLAGRVPSAASRLSAFCRRASAFPYAAQSGPFGALQRRLRIVVRLLRLRDQSLDVGTRRRATATGREWARASGEGVGRRAGRTPASAPPGTCRTPPGRRRPSRPCRNVGYPVPPDACT